MSDTSQGPGWWIASDDKWYAPELHADPDYRAKWAAPPAVIGPPESVQAEVPADRTAEVSADVPVEASSDVATDVDQTHNPLGDATADAVDAAPDATVEASNPLLAAIDPDTSSDIAAEPSAVEDSMPRQEAAELETEATLDADEVPQDVTDGESTEVASLGGDVPGWAAPASGPTPGPTPEDDASSPVMPETPGPSAELPTTALPTTSMPSTAMPTTTGPPTTEQPAVSAPATDLPSWAPTTPPPTTPPPTTPPPSTPSVPPMPAGPPTTAPYGAPPANAPYGTPPNADPYGAPPTTAPYGAPPTDAPYGEPPVEVPAGPPGMLHSDQPPVAWPSYDTPGVAATDGAAAAEAGPWGRVTGLVLLVAGLVAAFATFMPWYHVAARTTTDLVTGDFDSWYNDYGIPAIIAAVVLGAIGGAKLVGASNKIMRFGAVIAATALVVVWVVAYIDLGTQRDSLADEERYLLSSIWAGTGLWLVGMAGVAALVASILSRD